MKHINAQQILTETSKHPNSDEPLEKTYFRWLKDKNTIRPVGDVSLSPTINQAAYKVFLDMEGNVQFERIKPKTAELYKFESGPMKEVLSEIDRFWSLRNDYKKLGLVYSRGILLYGTPGGGKTSILNQVSELITNKGDIVIYASDVGALKTGLKALRNIEPTRQVVAMLEDIDELIKWNEQQLLHLLDGQDTVDGVLYLATTNYLDRFPPRLLRSGRFDKKIHVPYPPYEGRKIYFQNKLLSRGLSSEAEIEELVKKTDGMSFGDLSEIVTAVYALKEPLNNVLNRLQKTVNQTTEVNSIVHDVLPKSVKILSVSNSKKLLTKLGKILNS